MTHFDTDTHFGKYRILEKLGQGAQAVTYLCEAPDRTKVTLKRIDLANVDPWGYAEIFDREVSVIRELDHPYLPKYIDSFRHLEGDAPACHIVWEYIEGKSLEDCLDEGRIFSCDEILELSFLLCDILEYLSQRKILHRDIKPSNLILRPDGELFLIDFGIAKMRVDFERGSTVAGTFGYMAPEQFMGKAVPKSDIYATAITMMRLICNIDPQKIGSDLLRIPFEKYLPRGFSETGKLLLQCLSDPKVETRCDDFDLIRRALNAIRTNERTIDKELKTINRNLPPDEDYSVNPSQLLVNENSLLIEKIAKRFLLGAVLWIIIAALIFVFLGEYPFLFFIALSSYGLIMVAGFAKSHDKTRWFR